MADDLRQQLHDALGGAYAIERELTGGGMSRLFLATERSLNRCVVVKVLPREVASEVSAARFRREIELVAQLQHPHILPIFAAGVEGGLLYYVMPHVAGDSLKQRMEYERPLPVADALQLLREVADALAYAHHCGVVHRDVKPANILLAQGHALLADFGIARALDEGRPGDRITGPGMSVGTPGYMAPEQVAGEAHVDASADVYALAVVGYEMLAGAPPFTGPTAQAVLAAHLTADPAPLCDLRTDAPAAVCDAIHRALAKAPEQRFRTAAEFRDALADAEPPAAPRLDAPPAPRASSSSLGALLRGARSLLRRARPRAGGGVSASVVAVLPFEVRGSERLAYLREGMIDLLSTKLNGVGPLRSADPRALLAAMTEAERRAPDPARAREIAEHAGAGLYILGSLVAAGGRLHLSATLYDVRGARRATAHASADAEAQLFALVDELAIQLLAAHLGASATGLAELAASTTHSLPALRAYLEGESHFREGRFTPAKEAFARAVAADASFALAWYRLSVAAEWVVDRELQDAAAEEAMRHATRLPERDRRLLAAFVAWRRGSHDAEALYRDILDSYPNDVEAWFQLGEVLFHYGPLCGRPLAASRAAWERVLELDSKSLGALYHLARVAAAEGKLNELDALTERVLALSPQGERVLEARALRAFAAGDGAEQRRVLGELAQTGDPLLIGITRTVAMYAGSPAAAIPVARLLTGGARADATRALGHVQLAYLEVAGGRLAAAREELERGALYDAARMTETRALLAALPFLPSDAIDLAGARGALAALDASAVPRAASRSLFVRVHDELHPQLRAFALGMLGARLGDHAAALRHATELRTMGGTATHRRLAHALAEDVHAQVVALRGERATAVQTLLAVRWESPYDLPLASPLYSRAHARFLLATLLGDAGRAVESVGWFNSFGESSLYDLAYLAPSHLGRAAVHQRAGAPAEASQHLARAAALWSECDPALRPLLREPAPGVTVWPRHDATPLAPSEP